MAEELEPTAEEEVAVEVVEEEEVAVEEVIETVEEVKPPTRNKKSSPPYEEVIAERARVAAEIEKAARAAKPVVVSGAIAFSNRNK